MAFDDATVARSWQHLQALAHRYRNTPSSEYLNETNRLDRFTLQFNGLGIDWTHQLLNGEIFDALLEHAELIQLKEKLTQQFSGSLVNNTEARAALHTAMRGTSSGDQNRDKSFEREIESLQEFVHNVHDGRFRSFSGDPFTDALHIGIGGSYLGPAFACDALETRYLRTHLLSNLDSSQLASTLKLLRPETTLVIVASKSFLTPEVLKNFERVASWLVEQTGNKTALTSNVVAITASKDTKYVNPRIIFGMPQSVGGRFSLFSAMSLPVMLATGVDVFDECRKGAYLFDKHTLESELDCNMAAILALLSVWNSNFRGADSHAVLTYSERLRLLPAYLQQLEMESLGKSTKVDGQAVNHHTGQLVWGGPETESQHAFHQWLLQGTRPYSADFIATLEDDDLNGQWIRSNALAQQELMFLGHADADPHKTIRGGNGSTLILLDRAVPQTLGMLIALYEHKVACYGYLLQINPFDQFGVEHGKQLANRIDVAFSDVSTYSKHALQNERVRKIAKRRKDLKNL